MNLKYRPEIDGLRTIAVLAVIIYHAEFLVGNSKILEGGFFGVDIFFVISGYLITSLIITEYKKTGCFSYFDFYERRARRLLPAFLTVALFSLFFAWDVLLPSQLEDYAKSLLASVLFLSNFYWFFSLQEYGAESSLLKPFLHTWSLAVEEQFYIFFPLILMGLYKFTKHVFLFLLFIFIVSLMHAEFISVQHQSYAFYMLPSRFWELISGSLLAWYLLDKPRDYHESLYLWMPILGVLCIGFSLCLIGYNPGHPGLITLIPVVGSVLLIWFCRTDSLVGRILSSKLLVGIGLISYSLYLWHYPVFAFARLYNPSPSFTDKFFWIGVTFVLSIVSFKLIEKPFRDRAILKGRTLILTITISLMIIVAFSLYSIKEDGFRGRFTELSKAYGINEFDNKVLGRKTYSVLRELAKNSGFKYVKGYERRQLSFSEDSSTKKVLIVGNSHGRDLFNALYQNKELFEGVEFALYEIQIGAPKKEKRRLFLSPNFKAADIILISSRYNENKQRPGYSKDLKVLPRFINKLKKKKKQVVLTSYAVEFHNIDKKPVFDWYIENLRGKDFSKRDLERLYFEKRKQVMLQRSEGILATIAKNKGVKLLDKSAFICNEDVGRCDGLTDEGLKLYYDPLGHHTLEGAAYFGKRIFELNWLQLSR
ncbi:MAG: acyltransferase family protein [Colwellia sp.]